MEKKTIKKISKVEAPKPVKAVKESKSNGDPSTSSGVPYAVIKIGGTQLKVQEGAMYEVEKLAGEKGETMEIAEVLMYVNGEEVELGKPYLSGASVSLKIDSQKKGEKIDVFKYKNKSRYRRHTGHRSQVTRVLVEKISV